MAATRASGSRLLSGVRVLDLGNFLAGPIVGMHLGAMGADVVKVERCTGDDSRTIGPFSADGESSYFMSVNRGKRSIAVDTRTQPGKDILKRLAAGADVLVENFRPGVMDRLGVGYEELSSHNPGLIYCSVSGFGPTGPHAQRPAFDSLLQAAGGLISATGPAAAGAEPVRVGCSIVDMCSGLHSTIGILAALHQRGVTGAGQRVDTSMLATTAMLMESPISRHSIGGDAFMPRPEGLAHPAVAPFDGFKTRDGLLYIATSNDARAHVALRALGLGALCEDPAYATNPARMANRHELKRRMEERLVGKTTAEWEAELIPRACIYTCVSLMCMACALHVYTGGRRSSSRQACRARPSPTCSSSRRATRRSSSPSTTPPPARPCRRARPLPSRTRRWTMRRARRCSASTRRRSSRRSSASPARRWRDGARAASWPGRAGRERGARDATLSLETSEYSCTT